MNYKKLLIFLLICSTPFLIVIAVNELPNNPKRTSEYVAERCTWQCHNVTCYHWKQSYKKDPSPLKKMHKDVFDWYVTSLHGNPLDLNYGIINILVFLIVYPLFGGILLWNILTLLKVWLQLWNSEYRSTLIARTFVSMRQTYWVVIMSLLAASFLVALWMAWSFCWLPSIWYWE